ncbi:WcaI family glycosyltransferase [Sediminitomix flava]|uniref:Colanic acid biosynthesis glycosyl transferase WcaI n=1 Tax=Sediminitomix flava TaxID=379075 RepID=A0A315Z7M7_SEDFL|nr:WcaI family glycosyltransferase [Sediminitomix flava]PWJ40931.1 colanic acid biosynthesis glycosyl transferase WcaI [Sediminitomix flava]
MDIAIVGINYAPEDSAIGLYSAQMAEFLIKKNHNVSVITGYPYYPQWDIWVPYKKKGSYLRENINGVNVFRYKQYVPKKPTFLKRLIHLVDFTLGSILNIQKIKSADIVISVVPFTSSIFLGKLISWKTGGKLWVHIQDFEFDAAFESGLIGNKFHTRAMKKLLMEMEVSLLNKADRVSTISHGMLKKLASKSSSSSYYFPNWVDENKITPEKAKSGKWGKKSESFKVLYSGNIGAKQDWETYLKVVDFFKDDQSVEFVLVGNGAKRKELEKDLKEYKNIYIYNPVEYSELNTLLCFADLHVLFQKNDVIDTVMPSKLLGMMASEVPSLVTGNLSSEVNKVLTESQGGIFLDSNDFDGVVNTISDLKSDQYKSKDMGKNARKYIVDKFSYSKVLDDFMNELEELTHE